MGITIRKIETADFESVVGMIYQLAVHHDLTQYCEITVERLDTAMNGSHAMLDGLIAYDGNVAAGYALFCPHFSSFRGQTGLFLEDLYVGANYRRTGLGKRLMAAVAAEAADRGYGRIDFMVAVYNQSAMTFYEDLGADFNVEDRHYRITGDAFRRLAKRKE